MSRHRSDDDTTETIPRYVPVSEAPRMDVRPHPAPPKPRRWPWVVGIAAAFLLGLAIPTGGTTAPAEVSAETPGVVTGNVPAPSGEVVYEVTGSGKAMVTYGSNGGLNQETDVRLPWTKRQPPDPGVFSTYSVTAQHSSGSGELTCRITVGGEVIAEQTSSGQYAVASCVG